MPCTYQNFGLPNPQTLKLARQYLRAGAFRSPAGVRRHDAGAGAFGGIAGVWLLVGCWLGCAVGAVVCAVGVWDGSGLPCLPAGVCACVPGACVAVCRLCAWAGVALACWLVCACVCIACRACLACGICCRLGKYPAFPGPDRLGLLRPGGAVAALPVGLACCRCRVPGVAVHVAGCAYSPGGDAGGIMAGVWACCRCWIVCRMPWENTENFAEKFPGKTPTKKIFQKISPYGGTVCVRKIFAKRGLTFARNSAML